jgi:hypothetical protein
MADFCFGDVGIIGIHFGNLGKVAPFGRKFYICLRRTFSTEIFFLPVQFTLAGSSIKAGERTNCTFECKSTC